jgi:hypothetical protein
LLSAGNAPQKWTNSWFFLHNAPAHQSGLVDDFLAKKNVTTLEHPPLSTDLAADNFYLSPRLKSSLKGRRVCNDTDIMENAMEELKRLSQNVLQVCFQHFCCSRKWAG